MISTVVCGVLCIWLKGLIANDPADSFANMLANSGESVEEIGEGIATVMDDLKSLSDYQAALGGFFLLCILSLVLLVWFLTNLRRYRRGFSA